MSEENKNRLLTSYLSYNKPFYSCNQNINLYVHKGNKNITELRTILQRESQTDKISQQPENCENRNDPDLVQAVTIANCLHVYVNCDVSIFVFVVNIENTNPFSLNINELNEF
jgi:hypothetical protein